MKPHSVTGFLATNEEETVVFLLVPNLALTPLFFRLQTPVQVSFFYLYSRRLS